MEYHVLIQKDGEVWATTDGPPRDVANWLIREARRLKVEAAMLPLPLLPGEVPLAGLEVPRG